MTLVNFLIKYKTELIGKQVNCLLLVFGRIIENNDYFLLSEEAKRIYLVELVELEESFWDYIIKQTVRYEKLYAFS